MKQLYLTPGNWVVEFGNEIYATDGVGFDQIATVFDSCDFNVMAASKSLLSALQHLVEVYDSEDGKQYTTTSKREALAKAREAINLALGE